MSLRRLVNKALQQHGLKVMNLSGKGKKLTCEFREEDLNGKSPEDIRGVKVISQTKKRDGRVHFRIRCYANQIEAWLRSST